VNAAGADTATIHAVTQRDGSAIVTVDGRSQKIRGVDLTDVRALVREHALQMAARLKSPVTFITEDPAGNFTMIVHPDGSITSGSESVPAVDVDQPGEEPTVDLVDVDEPAALMQAPEPAAIAVQQGSGMGALSELLTPRAAPQGPETLQELPAAGETASAVPATRSPRKPSWALTLWRNAGKPQRALLIGACAFVPVAIAWSIISAGAHAAAPATAPAPHAAVTPATVTLPGWSTSTTWTATKIASAAAAGGRVLGVTGADVTMWDASSGKPVNSQTLDGGEIRVLAGTVDGKPALAAVTSTKAVVWVDDAAAPLEVDLSGNKTLEARTGAFLVTTKDRTFSAVTAAGLVPLTAPASQAIVLGASADTIVWASGAGHVILTSPNGTVVSDVALTPPAVGAKVTPGTGWVRAATATVTVTGWTLPDGTAVTARHNSATGELLGTAPDSTAGLLSPDGSEWTTGTERIALATIAASPLPEGFVPARYLGGTLYGAVRGHGDALLAAGSQAPDPVPASSERILGVAGKTLLTLTDGRLAAYAPQS